MNEHEAHVAAVFLDSAIRRVKGVIPESVNIEVGREHNGLGLSYCEHLTSGRE